MLPAVLVIITAVITFVGGYFANQLPSLREFKGSGILITRLAIWLTLLPTAYEILTSDETGAAVKAVTRYALLPLGLLLLQDSWRLIQALRGIAAEEQVPKDLRTRLLEAVKGEVAERLMDSITQQQLINLTMKQQLAQVDRVDQPKQISLEKIQARQRKEGPLLRLKRTLRLAEKETTLPAQETIFETFNRADVNRKLLILGEPGSGKTTTLLKLAETLVENALANDQEAMPVIFELSTWKNDRQPINDWLVEQLKLNYNIDPKTGSQWLREAQLLPLLDGLDELDLERQKLCVKSINDFVGMPYPRLVVCCRREEYEEGQARLSSLRGAVCLEPLQNGQIEHYFCQQLQQPEIWQAISQQSGLQQLLMPSAEKPIPLLRIPLFLTILSVAYDPDIPIRSAQDLFNAYIDRRLAQDTRQRARDQQQMEWAYGNVAQEPDSTETQQYLSWLGNTLQKNNQVELLIERMQPSWLDNRKQKLLYRLLYRLPVVLLVGLIFVLLGGLLFGLLFGLIFGLLVVLLVGLRGGLENDIKPVEKFRFSMSRDARREFKNGLLVVLLVVLRGGLLVSLLVGLLVGLIVGLRGGLLVVLIAGLRGGLIFCLIFCLIFGLQSDFEVRTKPNQGMWAAVVNVPLVTLASYGGAFGMLYLPSFIQGDVAAPEQLLLPAACYSLIFGIFLGGGYALMQHLTLRLILTHTGKTPWNYARFLNYCVERRLLQRIGGRYRFIHRELLDHFAAMETEQQNTVP